MRDAYNVYNSKLQRLVFPDGTPKGMKQALLERGVNMSRSN